MAAVDTMGRASSASSRSALEPLAEQVFRVIQTAVAEGDIAPVSKVSELLLRHAAERMGPAEVDQFRCVLDAHQTDPVFQARAGWYQ